MLTLQRIMMPEIYQGVHKKPPYFEGWYYKAQSPDGRIFAFIPGVSLNRGDSHSFLQILCSDVETADYLKFAPSAFKYASDRLEVSVGENRFSQDGFEINTDKISAKVSYIKSVPFSNKKYTTGIMGPFALVPFLECHHAIVTVKSGLAGFIKTKNETLKLGGGSGYIEKDWGEVFPDPYIWIESCKFQHSNASFMMSTARVPIFGGNIMGLIAFLHFDGHLIKFTSYNATHIQRLTFDKNNLEIILQSIKYKLIISATPKNGIVLKAPDKSGMIREVRENTNCRLSIELKTHSNQTVYYDESENASIEISGDISSVLKQE